MFEKNGELIIRNTVYTHVADAPPGNRPEGRVNFRLFIWRIEIYLRVNLSVLVVTCRKTAICRELFEVDEKIPNTPTVFEIGIVHPVFHPLSGPDHRGMFNILTPVVGNSESTKLIDENLSTTLCF